MLSCRICRKQEVYERCASLPTSGLPEGAGGQQPGEHPQQPREHQDWQAGQGHSLLASQFTLSLQYCKIVTLPAFWFVSACPLP